MSKDKIEHDGVPFAPSETTDGLMKIDSNVVARLMAELKNKIAAEHGVETARGYVRFLSTVIFYSGFDRGNIESDPKDSQEESLEDSDLHGFYGLLQLARNPKTDQATLRGFSTLANRKEIREAVAANTATPQDVLHSMFERDSSRNVRRSLRFNPITPVSILRKLEHETPVNEDALNIFAQDNKAPNILLIRLAHEKSDIVRTAVAKNRNTQAALLAKMAYDTCGQVVEAVMANQNTNISTLLMLAQTEANIEFLILNIKFKKYIAKTLTETFGEETQMVLDNLSLLKEIALSIFGHSKDDAGLLIARNRMAPDPVLRKFAVSNNVTHVTAVADNESIPGDLFEVLSSHLDSNVRSALAGNKKTPAEYLTTLAGDSDPNVRICVGANPNTPFDIIEVLSRDTDPEVRLSIASSDHASPEQLLRLANATNTREVRVAALENDNFPFDRLYIYARDPDARIRLAVQDRMEN